MVTRRWLAAATVGVALFFLALALPGSPVAGWLVGLMERGGGLSAPAGGGGSRIEHERSGSRGRLRVAVGAMVSPERTFLAYRELFELLAEGLEMDLDFLQRRSYAEVNELVLSGDVDLAWVCTGALRPLLASGGVEIVAVPVVGGVTVYHADLIVRADSGITSLEGLRGRRFAFTDPLSLTGRRVVEVWLTEQGETPQDFFGETFFTHAHDNSIHAVRRGLADGASVDSLVLEYLERHAPQETEGLLVIRRSRAFPIPPLVAPAGVGDDTLERLREALLGLGSSRREREALERIGVDRFVLPPPGLYSFK